MADPTPQNTSDPVTPTTDALQQKVEAAWQSIDGSAAKITDGIGDKLQEMAPDHFKSADVRKIIPGVATGIVALAGILLFNPIQSASTAIFGVFRKVPILGPAMEAVGSIASYLAVTVASAVTFRAFQGTPVTEKPDGIPGDSLGTGPQMATLSTIITARPPTPKNEVKVPKAANPRPEPVKLKPYTAPNLADQPVVAEAMRIVEDTLEYHRGAKAGENGQYNQDSSTKAAAQKVAAHESLKDAFVKKIIEQLQARKNQNQPLDLDAGTKTMNEVSEKNPSRLDKFMQGKEQVKAGIAKGKELAERHSAISPTFRRVGASALGVDGANRAINGETTAERLAGGAEVVVGTADIAADLLHSTGTLAKAAKWGGVGLGGLGAGYEAIQAYDSFNKHGFKREDSSLLGVNWEGMGHAENALGGVIMAGGALAGSAAVVTTGAVVILPAAIIGTGLAANELAVETDAMWLAQEKAAEGTAKLKSGDLYKTKGPDGKVMNYAKIVESIVLAHTDDAQKRGIATRDLKTNQLIVNVSSTENLQKLKEIIQEKNKKHQEMIDKNGSWTRKLQFWNWSPYSIDALEQDAITARTNLAGAEGQIKILDEMIAKCEKTNNKKLDGNMLPEAPVTPAPQSSYTPPHLRTFR